MKFGSGKCKSAHGGMCNTHTRDEWQAVGKSTADMCRITGHGESKVSVQIHTAEHEVVRLLQVEQAFRQGDQ